MKMPEYDTAESTGGGAATVETVEKFRGDAAV